MPRDGLRGIRLSALMLTGIAASPVMAIALWSLGRTMMELSNPCITWGHPQGEPMSMHVGPHDPCRGRGTNTLTKPQAALLAAFVPGGLLAAALLAIAGAASSRPRLMYIG